MSGRLVFSVAGRVATLAGFALLCVAGWVPSALAVAQEPIVAVEARIEETAKSTRLSIDLSRPVETNAFVLADPQRVVIDLPEINFQMGTIVGAHVPKFISSKSGLQGRGALPGISKAGSALIRTYRFGLLGPGRSRIVIDLNSPARIIRVSSERIGQSQAARLIIELAPTDAETFRVAANTAALNEMAVRRASVVPVAAIAAEISRPVIMIDPGHGGIDAGASSAGGAIEKAIVFEFAKILSSKLEATGLYHVQLTRNDDRFVSLADRVQAARDGHAALFISIHADTLSATQEVQGATIYTLAETASDAEAARLAEKENQADAAAGLVGREDSGDVTDILFDLTRRETRAYSHLFARTLVSVWQSAGRLNKNPQRSAGFKVLRAPDVPSVLIELGYLSSQKDVADLSSGPWREKTSDALVRSIADFFASRIILEPSAPLVIVPAAPPVAPNAWAGVAGAFVVPSVADR